jgi:hypothetical protein
MWRHYSLMMERLRVLQIVLPGLFFVVVFRHAL